MQYRLRTLLLLMILPALVCSYERYYRTRKKFRVSGMGILSFTVPTDMDEMLLWPAAKAHSWWSGYIIMVDSEEKIARLEQERANQQK